MSISLKNRTEEAQTAVTCSTCPVSHTLGCFYRSASAATASQQRCRCGAGKNNVNWALDGFIWGLCVCFFLIACLAYMPACALTQFDLQCQRERNIFSPSTGSLDSWNYTKKIYSCHRRRGQYFSIFFPGETTLLEERRPDQDSGSDFIDPIKDNYH